VHHLGVAALDEARRPAVALEEALQLLVRDAGEDGGVVDLVAVEVEHRQHRAVADRIEELVRVPGGGQRPGLGLAIAHHWNHQRVRIVEGGAEGMRDAVAELAPFVDRSRRLRRAVAADPSGERELLEELEHPLGVLALVRIDLRVGALQIDRSEDAGSSVAGAGQEDRVEVVLVDQPVEMGPDEAQSRARAPVSQEALLDVLRLQRLAQERIGAQVDHPGGEVAAGAPEGVHVVQLVGGEAVRVRGRGRHDSSFLKRAVILPFGLACVPDC
jgi:hypothetical protein